MLFLIIMMIKKLLQDNLNMYPNNLINKIQIAIFKKD